MTRWFMTFFILISLFAIGIGTMAGVSLFLSLPLLLLSLSATGLFTVWRKKYLATVAEAKLIYDNSLMSYLYSGNNDDIGAIGLALKMRTAELNAVVGRVGDASQNITHAASESSKRGSNIADILEKQKIETEQVATAINEMSTTIQSVAEAVTQASTASANGLKISIDGQQIVEQTIDGIHQLSSQLSHVDSAITRLIDGTRTIESVLGEINSIADQTNLLALNAAIEAARAGEHGRGFAVVADEVRALASRTQQSTEEVNKLLGQLQSESDVAVAAMKTGTELSQQCINFAANTRASLENIASEVSDFSSMSEQIATAVEEQSVVTEQVNQNIVSISDMSVKSQVYGDESATLSNDLLEQLRQQQSLVLQFKH
jgi:methyl-accepting chemotaxis protein